MATKIARMARSYKKSFEVRQLLLHRRRIGRVFGFSGWRDTRASRRIR